MIARKAFPLLAAALLLGAALVAIAPLASAAPNPWDTSQQDIWRQAQPGSYSSAYTCGPCPSQGTIGTAVLQPGDYYILVNGGCNSCGSAGPTNAYTMSYNLFTVNWGATTTITGVSSSITGMTVLESGGCSSSCYAYLGFTLTSTQTLSYSGYHPFGAGGQCGFGCSYGGGTISTSALNGYAFVGAFWTGYSGAQNYHTVWFQAGLSQLSEAGILSTQMTRTPTTTQWTWTQIQGDQQLVNVANNAGANPQVGGIQSFSADLTKGTFVDTTSVRISGSCSVAATASLSFAISSTLAYPWNVTNELANISTTMSIATGTNNGLVTTDWANALVSSDDAKQTFSTPTASASGVAYTKATTAYYGNFPPSLAAGGTFYFHWNLALTAGTCSTLTVNVNDANTYTGGTIYSDAGSTWTQQSARDLTSFVMNVYGGTTVLYAASQTQKDVGGASYVYLCEVQRDANPQRYQLSTSYGGAARIGSYQAAGSSVCNGVVSGGQQQTIQEWRLGYELPVNASQTVTLTLNTSGASRNLLYVGTLGGTQPTHRNLGGTYSFTATSYNPITFYKLYSTNDYFATLSINVRACTTINDDGSCGDAAAGKAGPAIPNGTYVASISNLRTVAGSWDANGTFNLSGQDVQGGSVALTIAAQGYLTDNGVIISVPSAPGNYTANLTMLPGTQGTGLGVTQSSVRVSFNATNPQFNSGQVMAISINRTLPVDLWVILFQTDANGNPNTARGFAPYDWTPSQNNELDFSWPDGRMLNDADTGSYVLSAFIKSSATTKGVLVAYDSIGVNQGAPKVGTSLLTNLNVAGQNSIAKQAQISSAVTTGAITEATVQQDFLTWLDWFPRTDLFVPNAVLYPALFMMGALMLRFGRNRWGA